MFKKINIPLLIVGELFIWGKECYGTKTTKMDKVPSNDVSAYEGTPGFVGNPLIPLLVSKLSIILVQVHWFPNICSRSYLIFVELNH